MSNIQKLFLLLLIIGLPAISPAQVPTQWDARGMGGGGAVYAPSISPFNGNEAYLGCDMSVMSHTLDFGNTWRTISFDTLMGHRHSKVNFTNHPDTLYVESLDQYSAKNFPSISVNGGVSWSVVPNKAFWGAFGSFRLFANPNDSKQIIASTATNIYFSNNWGSSFASIHSGTAQGASQLHLAGVLYTDDTIFVSTDKGMIISPDNGTSWNGFVNYNTMGITTGAGNEGVVTFEGAVSGNTIRFICITISANNLTIRTEPRDIQYFQKIYRLNYNTSALWTDITPNLKNADNVLNNYNYTYEVAMKHNCVDTFYVTGQTRVPATAAGAKFGTVFKSMDGGNSFNNMFLKDSNPNNNNISTGWMGGASSTQWTSTWKNINTTEGLCVDPNDINRIMRSDFSMVCISEDGGGTWDQRYVASMEHPPLTLIDPNDLYVTSGLQTTVSHWVHWLSPSRVLACYSDVMLHESNDGGISWGMLTDSIWSQKINDISMLCSSPSGRLYAPEGETLGNNGDWSDYRLSITHAGKITWSDDANHWHLLKTFNAPASWAAFNPNDSTVMYVTVLSEMADTVGGIWKCSGLPNAPVWTKLSHPPRTERRPTQILALNNGDLVSVFGGRDSSTVQPISYSFRPSSGVFLSNDGGLTWSDLCAGYPGMQKDVRFLTIDPNDPSQNTWLVGVGFSGMGTVPGLYRTTNRGATWNNIWSGKSVLSVTFNPVALNEMYVCTVQDGLFYATGATSNFPVVSRVPSYPFRAPERVFFNPYNSGEVWVTSWGNGLRVGNLFTTGNPLPVELLSFVGYESEKNNILQWTTASEIQNEKFEIETSSDLHTFVKIGEVRGGNNSSSILNYSFTHFNPPLGINYYRLRQLDYNGKVNLSATISIKNPSTGFDISYSPVPFHDRLVLEVYSTVNYSHQLKVVSAEGKIVFEKMLSPGTIFLNTSEWKSGVYFIVMDDVRKVIVKD